MTNEGSIISGRTTTGRPPLRLAILLGWAALTIGAIACNRWSDLPASPPYLPTWAEARQSLESALIAWRDAPSPLPDSFDSSSMIFVDKQRRPGQRLRSFAILGQTEVENVRQFTIRLQLDQEESPVLVRYNVLGRNPIWIFRLEDYEMISHWEHPMDSPVTSTAQDPLGKSDRGPPLERGVPRSGIAAEQLGDHAK